MRETRAGCRAITVIPKAKRPATSTAKTGAHPWRNRAAVPKTRVTDVRILGPYREVHQLIGIAKAMFPQKADDPSRPCWNGEILRSALMAGRRIPRVANTMNPETPDTIQTPITTHR